MIRDSEIDRLIKYAQSMGLTVHFKPYKPGNAGALWEIGGDGRPFLTMYTWPRQSKTRLILNFIHELAHHLAWVYNNRELSNSLINALNKDDEGKNLTKRERYLIYKAEKDDAEYRDQIMQELDIKIPVYKYLADVKVDIWFYKQFYLKGEYPSLVEVYDKYKEFLGE